MNTKFNYQIRSYMSYEGQKSNKDYYLILFDKLPKSIVFKEGYYNLKLLYDSFKNYSNCNILVFDNVDFYNAVEFEFMLNLINDTKQIDELCFNCIKIKEYLNELIKFIKNNHTIKTLSISNFNFTDKEFAQFCEAIKENDTLTSLFFTSNIYLYNITSICNLIKINKHISELHFNNLLYNIDFKPLIETLKTNDTIKVFEINDSHKLFNECCEMLKVNKRITSFVYDSNNDNIDLTKFKEVLEVNKNITSINLSGCKSDDWTPLINTLLTYNNLIYLNLNGCNIKDYKPLYIFIKNSTTLKSININHYYNDDYKEEVEIFLDALKTNKTIEELSVQGLVINDPLKYLKIVYQHPTLKEINIQLDKKYYQTICDVLFSAECNIANIGYQPCISYDRFYKSNNTNKQLYQFVHA